MGMLSSAVFWPQSGTLKFTLPSLVLVRVSVKTSVFLFLADILCLCLYWIPGVSLLKLPHRFELFPEGVTGLGLFFLWDCDLNSGLHTCKAGALVLEPHL
jgi:hypothetical protein